MADNVKIRTNAGQGAVVATDERTIDGQAVQVQIMSTQSFKTKIDDVGNGITYVGEAPPGTSESSSAWRIRKITEVGSDISILWAHGNDNFDNSWNNRLSIVYS